MPSSTSSSEPSTDQTGLERRERRSRRVVAAVAALWLAVECLFALGLPVHLGRHEVDQRVAEVAMVEAAPRVVLLSDSISYGVLEYSPEPVEGLLDLSSNQSIGVAGNAFLLERLRDRLASVDGDGRVERVVYVVSPLSLGTDLASGNFLESNFASVFVAEREITAVRELLGFDGLADSMREHALLRRVTPPSHLRRGHLRRPLDLALRELGRRLRDEPPPTEPPPATTDRIARDAELDEPPISEATRRFLPRLAAAAEALGAELELRLAPVPPSLHAAWDENGFNARLSTVFRNFADGLDNLRADPRPLHRPARDAAFYDGSHLYPPARPDYAAALAEVLGRGAGER